MSTIETEFDTPAVPVVAGARNILALDLGTQLGWSTRDVNGNVRHGSISFHAKRTDGPGQRWLKFSAHLSALKRELGEIHVAYYEHVMAHGTKQFPNTIAAHVYGGFLAQLEIFCDVNRIRLEQASVTTVKKHWTGRGNAAKDDMVDEARRRGFKPVDDNAADSLAILHYAIEREIR